jgi:hypothetical protein
MEMKDGKMINFRGTALSLNLMSFGLLAAVSLITAGSSASAQSRKHAEDAQTCANFGNAYGTPEYSYCMLEQQRRRDLNKQRQLEQMALTSQIAKDGQIMAERARRLRCERKPSRRECRVR